MISLDAARDLIRETLVACNTSAANAGAVAEALIGAELAGQIGHGLRRVPSYAAQARSGKVDGQACPTGEKTRPGTLRIDAGHGFAYPALDLALATLPQMARDQGVALAGVHRSHHAGVTGIFVERLAEAGLVGLMMVNSPPAMAPWGGKTPLFGTNPLAFAAPLPEGPPLVIDLSLSKVARGKIMAAQQKGEAIPEGWALDAAGAATSDPAAALQGSMVPMGDAKGAALALMVELLCAGLTGANYAYEASSFFEAEGTPPGTGQFLLAIDPAALGGPAAVGRIGEMAARIEGTEGARLPGRRRQARRAQILRDGIDADAALLDEIRALRDSGES